MTNQDQDQTPVTSGSRKNLIWSAYQDLEKEVKAEREANATAEEAKAAARIIHLENEHGEFDTDQVIDATAKLKMAFGSQLSEIGQRTEAAVNRLNDLNDHIEAKDAELEEIYQIERSADTLNALGRTQDAAEAKFKVDTRTTREEWDRQRQERDRNWRREDEDHKYNFKRKVKEETDEFKDNLAAKQKEIDGQCEVRLLAVAVKENEQLEAIQTAENLEAEMTSMVTAHNAALIEADEHATKRAANSHGFETRAIKSKADAEITVLQGANESLQGQMERGNNEIAKLQNQLSEANTKIQELAMASLQSEAKDAAFKAMTDNVAKSGSK